MCQTQNYKICWAYKNKAGKHYKVTKSHIYIPRVTGLPHKMQGLFVNIYFRILQAGADLHDSPDIATYTKRQWSLSYVAVWRPTKINAHQNEINMNGHSLIYNKNT